MIFINLFTFYLCFRLALFILLFSFLIVWNNLNSDSMLFLQLRFIALWAFMCMPYIGLILTVVEIKEILKALNNFLAAAKTEHCFCSKSSSFKVILALKMYSQIKAAVRLNTLSLWSNVPAITFLVVFFKLAKSLLSILFFPNENGNAFKAA